MHHGVVVLSEDRIDPDRGLTAEGVEEDRIIGLATVPGLHCKRDVKGSSHIGSVEVVTHRIAEGDLRCLSSEKLIFLDPRSVLVKSHTSLVSLDLTTNDGLTVSLSRLFGRLKLASFMLLELRALSIGCPE